MFGFRVARALSARTVATKVVTCAPKAKCRNYSSIPVMAGLVPPIPTICEQIVDVVDHHYLRILP